MVNGKLLKYHIESKGFKVQEVANGIDVDDSTLYRAINSNKVSLENADKLARFLNLTVDEAIAVFFAQYVA